MVRYSQQGESSSSVSQSLRSAVNTAALEHYQCSTASSPSSPSPSPVVVVCGTAFIMAAARAELGIVEPRDSESLSDPLSGEDKDVDSQVLFITKIFLFIHLFCASLLLCFSKLYLSCYRSL